MRGLANYNCMSIELFSEFFGPQECQMLPCEMKVPDTSILLSSHFGSGY